MAFIITRLCSDCKSCVTVCPADCIYEYTGSDPSFLKQLYIDSDECIDCGACEPECPWQAIFEADNVPKALIDDIALNGKIMGIELRAIPTQTAEKPTPSQDEIEANNKKWGL